MDKKRIFTVINLQTTGTTFRDSRVIEIGLARLENGEVVDRLVSFINPERPIPEYVTAHTGIDDDVLRKAPNFAEIAHRIDRMVQGSVLVGHQVSRAYHALRSEFRYLGYDFESKKVGTERLAKKVLPSLFSYEFDGLCSSLGIPLMDKNSTGDMLDASLALLQRLLSLDDNFVHIESFLAPKPVGRPLSTHIAADRFAKLPSSAGIYTFHDKEGKIIYVGKAKHIKKRVLSHFLSRSGKEIRLCRQTSSIDFEETGSELLALLLEADMIAKRLPEFNTIQKKTHTAYHIKAHKNKAGILQFMIEEKPAFDVPSELFFTKAAAKKKLEKLCGDFDLCPKYSGLQRKKGRCDHVKFPFCSGVCHGDEAVHVYNGRASEALATLKADTESYIIREKGRCTGEQGFVLVLQGIYQGFGFIDGSQQITGVDELQNVIEPRKSTYHTAQIMVAYRKKFPYKVKGIAMAL